MNILVVAKHSKYEWERKTFNLSHDELVAKYSKEHSNLDAILKSHDKQVEVRQMFKSIMPASKLVMLNVFQMANSITGLRLADPPDLVIVLGGDNAFTSASHFVNNTPILGVNSDPERSNGCLTRWAINDKKDVIALAEKLENKSYIIEPWTRLKAVVNNKIIAPATSEYFFGEKQRNRMSRHIIVYKGKEYEQKCSGIIFATGSGSTGWHNSCSKYSPWNPTDSLCVFTITEIYSSKPNDITAPVSECFGLGDEITLYSLNNDGLVSIDSWEEHEFLRGSEAKIRVGKPLNVVIPNEQ